jgi:hypothetical protein
MRAPDRPPGRFTYLRERIVKWAAIFGVAFFIVVFVVVIAKDLGREPTQGELRATVVAEAARATRAAR